MAQIVEMSPLAMDELWENITIEGNSEKFSVHSLVGPLCKMCIQSKAIYDTTNSKNLYFVKKKQTSVFKLASFLSLQSCC